MSKRMTSEVPSQIRDRLLARAARNGATTAREWLYRYTLA